MPSRTAAERRLETVHLVRHAHAGDSERWDGPDELRPLTRKGRRQSERVGALLVRAGIQPDVIISSPKVRAFQTAELIGFALGMDPTIDERLAGGCYLGCLDGVLADSGARTPMVVGHDPDFSILVSTLLGSGPQEMRKGALASIDITLPLRAGSGVLRWLVPPDLLVGSDGSETEPPADRG